MTRLIQRFLKDESGASMIEYVLIAAVISIGAIAVMPDARDAINSVWTRVTTALTPANN